MLSNLNIYKSPGPDGIPPRILKECSQVLSSPLAFVAPRIQFIPKEFARNYFSVSHKNLHTASVYKLMFTG